MFHVIPPQKASLVDNPRMALTAVTQAQALASDTALLVIDCQNIFCIDRPNSLSVLPNFNVPVVERALDRIDAARDYADAAGIPTFILYLIKYDMPYDNATPFTDQEYGLYRQRLSGLFELAVKTCESAFKKNMHSNVEPELPALLKEYANVKHLVVTGFNTSMCVFETAKEALERKFQVSVLTDCTANTRNEYAGR